MKNPLIIQAEVPMPNPPISQDQLAEILGRKVKQYLIQEMGTSCKDANSFDLYRAVSHALREQIMINWLATWQTIECSRPRLLYYFSMEFLPGRLGVNNAINLGQRPLVNKILTALGRKERDLLYSEPDPALGNGGLGRLASCLMDSLATMRYPCMGYGLRYQYGLFEQELWRGEQIERPDCWLLRESPWEFRRDTRSQMVRFAGQIDPTSPSKYDLDYKVKGCEEVRALAYDIPIVGFSKSDSCNINTLRLWSTKESPRNFQFQKFNAGQLDSAAENTTLTDVLYPNDQNEMGKRIRLKQEFLLVSASLKDIIDRYHRMHGDHFIDFGDKVRIQINDTHPSLAIAELICQLLDRGLNWRQAVDNTQQAVSYTNHTILREALEQWKQSRIALLLPRQYMAIERLNLELCEHVRAKFPDDEERVRRMSILENQEVRMAHLAICGSHHTNGVAALHSKLLRDVVFSDFAQLFPKRFVNITNGVTHRKWILGCNPLLAEFFDDLIGDQWQVDFTKIKDLRQFADDPKAQSRFMEIKKINKTRLIQALPEIAASRDERGDVLQIPSLPSPDALFDVQIKRIHEYKRQLLNALHLILLFWRSKRGVRPKAARVVIFSGKAAAGYEMAKNIIRLICAIARKIASTAGIRDDLIIFFVENYNVSRAELVIPAADLSEQISTAGMEASGTGNMKLSMNGALTIGTEDGANIEMRQCIGDENWPFAFGSSERELQLLSRNGYDARAIVQRDQELDQVLQSLGDGTFAVDEAEHRAFCQIKESLLQRGENQSPDRYFVLNDFADYARAQERAQDLYLFPKRWARAALLNIAGMGSFSSDRSVLEYAEKIWGLNPLKVDAAKLGACQKDHQV